MLRTRVVPWLALCTVACVAAAGAPAAAPRLATAAVDARAIADREFRALGVLALVRKLTLRLTQVGFAVVAPDRQPDVRLVLRATSGELTVEARAGERRTIRIVARESAAGSDLDAFHLEVIHKAVEAARQVRPAAGRPGPLPPATRPASRPAPATAPASRIVLAPPRRRPVSPSRAEPWVAELGALVAALYRIQGTDPIVRAGVRAGRWRGLGLHAALGVTPAGAGPLTVVEWQAQLGASWRLALAGEALGLDLVLLAGLGQHLYRLAGTTPGDGTALSFIGTLAADLAYRPLRYLALRLWLAPGLSELTRRHTLDGRDLWQRSAFRLEAGAGGSLVIP